jgi:hypothetical protein
MGRRGWALTVAGLSMIACSSENKGTSSEDAGAGPSDGSVADVAVASDGGGSDAAQSTTQIVGAAGGSLSAGGAVLTIPAGALSSDTAITVTTSDAPTPAGYTGLSPIYSLAPAGTTLLTPATIAIKMTAQAAGATVFWSNTSGGYDALPTSVTGETASASITRLAEGFCGEQQEGPDAAVPSDAGPAPGTTDDASADAVAPDAGALTDAGASDGAPSDAGTPAISVTVDGTPTAFAYNVSATLLQAWWKISADDSSSPTHWTIQLLVPTNAETLNCGGLYPSITYTHYVAGSGDAGTAGATFTTSVTGASCTIDETTTATTPGQQAEGTFAGTLVQSSDAGGPTSHTLTGGSYGVVVP